MASIRALIDTLALDGPHFIGNDLNHYTDSKIAAKPHQYWLDQLTGVRSLYQGQGSIQPGTASERRLAIQAFFDELP